MRGKSVYVHTVVWLPMLCKGRTIVCTAKAVCTCTCTIFNMYSEVSMYFNSSVQV